MISVDKFKRGLAQQEKNTTVTEFRYSFQWKTNCNIIWISANETRDPICLAQGVKMIISPDVSW